MLDKTKLHIGCGNRNFGEDWINLDISRGEHIHLHDARSLPLKDNSINTIYSAHMIEYLDRSILVDYLREWHRVLKPEGELYLSVPDFEVMSKLYTEERVPLHSLVGPLYGKMGEMDNPIYHKTVWDFSSIGEHLKLVGFRRVERWQHSELSEIINQEYDDHSKARINGKLISLNVRCKK